ncbi:MAG: TrkA family potassium uptake protein [Gemmatimonadota bacterium]
MKRIVVIGLGNFGSAVAEALAGKGHDVIAVDHSQEAVDRIASRVARAVVADGTNLSVLAEVGCAKADAGVISTGDDITASILATLSLRDLEVANIYVKVISTPHARVIEKIGATETVFPERDSGIRLAESISTTSILNYVALGPGFSFQEMAVPEAWIGRTLRDLDLRQSKRVTIVALHDFLRNEVVTAPNPDAPLKESDTLFVVGSRNALEALGEIQ